MAESMHSGLYAGERSIKRNKVIANVIVWAFIGVLINRLTGLGGLLRIVAHSENVSPH
jgi:hypothetical protein